MSPVRAVDLRTPATIWIARSPTACPWRSLTDLKWSMSSMMLLSAWPCRSAIRRTGWARSKNALRFRQDVKGSRVARSATSCSASGSRRRELLSFSRSRRSCKFLRSMPVMSSKVARTPWHDPSSATIGVELTDRVRSPLAAVLRATMDPRSGDPRAMAVAQGRSSLVSWPSATDQESSPAFRPSSSLAGLPTVRANDSLTRAIRRSRSIRSTPSTRVSRVARTRLGIPPERERSRFEHEIEIEHVGAEQPQRAQGDESERRIRHDGQACEGAERLEPHRHGAPLSIALVNGDMGFDRSWQRLEFPVSPPRPGSCRSRDAPRRTGCPGSAGRSPGSSPRSWRRRSGPRPTNRKWPEPRTVRSAPEGWLPCCRASCRTNGASRARSRRGWSVQNSSGAPSGGVSFHLVRF